MKTALWIVQGLLALAFVGAGAMKLMTPHAELAAQMSWAADAPTWLPTFIGLAEVAGGLGLVLPAATRIKPWLTPLAAVALAVVMVLAIGTHVALGEAGQSAPSFVLLLLSLFVAWGRTKKVPIVPAAA